MLIIEEQAWLSDFKKGGLRWLTSAMGETLETECFHSMLAQLSFSDASVVCVVCSRVALLSESRGRSISPTCNRSAEELEFVLRPHTFLIRLEGVGKRETKQARFFARNARQEAVPGSRVQLPQVSAQKEYDRRGT